MTALVFVDANVFVCARDPRDPAKQRRAADWIEALWNERTGRTSTQALTEYYVTLTRKLRPAVAPDDAWDDVRSLLAWRPQPIDESLLPHARETERRHRLSWWDSMIVAAAQLQDCSLLLSEDLHDGTVFGSVTVRNPFSLAVEEARAAYKASAAARSHPPRGRPPRRPR